MTTATMNRFAYQARDQRGALVQGFVQALSMAEATKTLRGEGKYIMDLKPAKPASGAPADHAAAGNRAAAASAQPRTSGRAKPDEVMQFTLQLSVMVDTGVPLSDALTALSEQKVSPNFAAVLTHIVEEVTAGKDLSSSLERYPKIFPKYYVSLVRASEMSGNMGPILRRLSEYLLSQRDTAKKVKGALIYPAFMLVMCVGVTIFLLTTILPRFTVIFAQRKAALPVPTQILMAVSNALISYWYAWIAAVAAITAFCWWFFGTPRGRRFLDYVKLHTPILGSLFHKLYLSRSLQTIGTMIQSGVQVFDCLTIVRDVAGNTYYAELWDEVRTKIQSGQQLSEPLLKSKLIPRSVAQMICSGEKTGELPAVMNRLASFMDEDLRTAVKTTTQFIEPVMIGVMGAIIGGVAIAMLLPILTISQVMAKGG